MTKYRTRTRRTRADDDVYAEDIWRPESGLMAFDSHAIPTGVLDKSGNEYWREPEPIGFRVFESKE